MENLLNDSKLKEIMNRIQARRLELELSYQDLANKTNMSKSTLQRYETGSIKNMPVDKLGVIAKALNVNPIWLLGLDSYNKTHFNNENNLSKVVVPEVAQGKAVYLSGRGPNYLTVSIAESYAHTNSSVSLNQPGTGYTCSITHSREKKLGDLTKDPLGKEKIKEELEENKKEKEQER